MGSEDQRQGSLPKSLVWRLPRRLLPELCVMIFLLVAGFVFWDHYVRYTRGEVLTGRHVARELAAPLSGALFALFGVGLLLMGSPLEVRAKRGQGVQRGRKVLYFRFVAFRTFEANGLSHFTIVGSPTADGLERSDGWLRLVCHYKGSKSSHTLLKHNDAALLDSLGKSCAEVLGVEYRQEGDQLGT